MAGAWGRAMLTKNIRFVGLLLGLLGWGAPPLRAQVTPDLFRVGDAEPSKAPDYGWSVAPQVGRLTVTVPIGTMPGEIAFPVAFILNASFQSSSTMTYPTPMTPYDNARRTSTIWPIHGTCELGHVENHFNVGADYLLEDGRRFNDRDFYHTVNTNDSFGVSINYGSIYSVANGSSNIKLTM